MVQKHPPVPLPDNLWGEQWRFATLPATDLTDAFTGRMLPILELPTDYLPLALGLSSDLPIPGIVIDGGRRSMQLSRWLQQAHPVALRCIAGAPDGLVLESGELDRWILATFDDPEVCYAGQEFERRKQASQGLHFILVQPDNSGMTYSGFWLLKAAT
jgi:RNA-binding protein Tab2/Atab2